MLSLDSGDREVPFGFFHIVLNANIRFEIGIARLNGAGQEMEQRFFPSSQAQITVGHPF